MLVRSQGNRVLFFQDELDADITPAYFDGDYWQQQEAIIGSAFGRGVTWFFKLAGDEYVLRHYRRGGLIGKMLTDGYCYTGLKSTRAYQEFMVTQKLLGMGLPVPKPIAGQVIKHGLYYQADLITAKITGARDLVKVLSNESLTEQQYLEIGRMIRDFHNAGLWHADLNIHNIIIDENNKLWLIDFDRCKFKKPDDIWKKSNLDRLKRSFLKENKKIEQFHWQESDWKSLLTGYNN